MTLPTNKVHAVLANPYVAFFGSIASIAAFLWFIFEKIYTPSTGGAPPSDDLEVIILIVAAVVILGIGFYSVRVRQENRAFRKAAEKFHKINHDYRDVLCKMFGREESVTDRTELAKQELLSLESVCQTIAQMFNWFTHGECMVTVKLITRADNGKLFASTYVRSESKSERDTWEPRDFAIGVGQNSAFDKAIQISPGRISHFFSPDLTQENGYRNQRDNWNRFYQSAIVVPIRYVNREKVGSPDASDDIGFLCVDTMSTNRLNDDFHLHYLAAVADQMYNFMSLMRGKYSVGAARGE